MNKGKFPWRWTGIGALTLAAGILLARTPADGIRTIGWWAIMLTAPTLLVRLGWWFRTSRSSQALVNKWTTRSRKTAGLAGYRDHFMFTSRREMRRLARQVRPTLLGDATWWQVYTTPVGEYATELARIGGFRLPMGRRVYGGKVVYSSVEHHTLTIGPSGSGKSGSLACRVIDAPGAVVAVSTTADLYENTVAIRQRRGPVLVMNLGGVAGVPNNLKWSILSGCRDPQVAEDRSEDLLPSDLVREGSQWVKLAQNALSTLMHAAACGGLSMRTVYRWVSDPDNSLDEVLRALETSPEQKMMRQAAAQFFNNHKPTRQGVITAMTPALTWLRDSRIVSIGDARGDDLVDLQDAIRNGGSVYLIGEENHTTSGLVTALIAEVVRTARKEANQMSRQRLDPPLSICLDEAALVCWVPLHQWTAELRARGITIHIAIQARSQLRDRWGDKNTGTIFTNCASVLVYGGCKDPDDLRTYSAMTGTREDIAETKDAAGKVTNRSTRLIPVLDAGEVASLEGGTALIFRRDMKPYLGRPQMVWERRDYRRARRAGISFVMPETMYEADAREESMVDG